MTKNITIGTRVVIQERGNGWDGATGVVTGIERDLYSIKYDDPKDTPFEFPTGRWSERYLVVLPAVPTELPRASLTHETSRSYAATVVDAAMPSAAKKILTEAAAGEEVDVFEFRKAATRALSAATTGDTRRRANMARKARHLIYWADAILENHLRGLPVYEGGPRSPRIFELEQELNQLKQAASDERRRLVEEIDDQKQQIDAADRQIRNLQANIGIYVDTVNGQDERITALIREKTEVEVQVEDLLKGRTNDQKALEHVYSECNEFHAALEYAFTLLSNADQARLAGFRDGYATRCNDAD